MSLDTNVELDARVIAVDCVVTQKGGSVVRTISDPSVTKARVTVRVPELFTKDLVSGEIRSCSVKYSIETKGVDSDWVTVIEDTISGKTTYPYQRSLSFPLIGKSPWQIRVTRQSPDHADDGITRDKLFWATYTELRESKLRELARKVLERGKAIKPLP